MPTKKRRKFTSWKVTSIFLLVLSVVSTWTLMLYTIKTVSVQPQYYTPLSSDNERLIAENIELQSGLLEENHDSHSPLISGHRLHRSDKAQTHPHSTTQAGKDYAISNKRKQRNIGHLLFAKVNEVERMQSMLQSHEITVSTLALGRKRTDEGTNFTPKTNRGMHAEPLQSTSRPSTSSSSTVSQKNLKIDQGKSYFTKPISKKNLHADPLSKIHKYHLNAASQNTIFTKSSPYKLNETKTEKLYSTDEFYPSSTQRTERTLNLTTDLQTTTRPVKFSIHNSLRISSFQNSNATHPDTTPHSRSTTYTNDHSPLSFRQSVEEKRRLRIEEAHKKRLHLYLDDFTDNQSVKPPFKRSNRKLVLLYSRFLRRQEWPGLKAADLHRITEKYSCPVHNCDFTYNRQLISDSDAVIFHAPDIQDPFELKLLNKFSRNLKQHWVFFSLDSPVSERMPDLRPYDGLFNLTMTYHSASDIHVPFGSYRMLTEKEKNSVNSRFSRERTPGAVWYVSDCNSYLRNWFATKFNERIPIFVGGSCSRNFKKGILCRKSESQRCTNLIRKVKFYLSFERDFCDEYVTEKYWKHAIQNGVVPIVLGGANYRKVAIPGSYLDSVIFNSINEASDHIYRVALDDNIYRRYFKWKDTYAYVDHGEWPFASRWVCDLCKKLNEPVSASESAQNLSKWWSKANMCSTKREQRARYYLHMDARQRRKKESQGIYLPREIGGFRNQSIAQKQQKYSDIVDTNMKKHPKRYYEDFHSRKVQPLSRRMPSAEAEKLFVRDLQRRYTRKDVFDIHRPRTKRKVILLYTTMFRAQEWTSLPAQKLPRVMDLFKCPIRSCDVTYNRYAFNISDAVVFHMPDAKHSYSVRLLHRRGGRSKNQSWVFFASESPVSSNTPPLQGFDGLFNITMTYHKNSDIPIPYGLFTKLKQRRKVTSNFATSRRNAAVWFASNCGIGFRNTLVRQLSELFPVYVGGTCSQYHSKQVDCPHDSDESNRRECAGVIKSFKFYLSFENCFCDDYLTEKYWTNAISNNVIPIVMGGANYSRLAIPGSYIDILDFDTVEELAAYLLRLSSNDTEYNAYFEWKEKYRSVNVGPWPYPQRWLCELCSKLHDEKRPPKVYDSLSQWWSPDNMCSTTKQEQVENMIYTYRKRNNNGDEDTDEDEEDDDQAYDYREPY